jgi:ketosteroid isomerase-like protein
MIKYGLACAWLALAYPANAQGSPPPQISPQLSADGRGAVAAVDAFHQALARGDQGAAGALMASDSLIYESGGVERGKAEYAAHHLAADAAFAQAVSRTLTRRQVRADGALAWVASEATVKGSYKGRAINSRSIETMVLRRTGPVWRIVHIHWSSADVK